MVKWCYGKIGAFISLLVAELELGDIQFQYTMVVQYWSARVSRFYQLRFKNKVLLRITNIFT